VKQTPLRVLHRLSEWLHRTSTGPITLLAVVVAIVFGATVLPAQSRQASEAGRDISPDTSFLYSTGDLYNMAEAYGIEGRQAYVRSRWTFDLVFPIVYLSFLVTTISWLTRRGAAPRTPWQRVNIAPVFGALFDFIENTSTSLVMGRYPAFTPVIDFLAPISSALKWVFVGGSMLLLIAAFARAVVAAFRRRARA
jgi:hypothetical protein